MGRLRLLRRALAMASCLAVLEPAAAGFGGSVGASTDSVYRGISESAGDPSVQAGAHYAWENGAFAGVRGASIKRRSADGTQDLFQLDSFAGYGFSPSDAWSGRLMLIHYAYPWSDPLRRGYDEFAATVTWLGRVSLSAAVAPARPGIDDARDPAWNYELALRCPVAASLSLDAGAGYHDLSRVYDTAYAYWSAGATWTVRGLSLGLAWIGADDAARDGYGDAADDRVVGSALWVF